MYAGFSGAAVPAIDAARNDTIIGRPFGSAMPTRSPRPTPAAAKLFGYGLNLSAERTVTDSKVVVGKNDGRFFGRNMFE